MLCGRRKGEEREGEEVRGSWGFGEVLGLGFVWCEVWCEVFICW